MQGVRNKGIVNGTNDGAAESGIIAGLLSRRDSFRNYHRFGALNRFFGFSRNQLEFKSWATCCSSTAKKFLSVL